MAKKSGTAIRDFFISLGFDATDVEKGFKKLQGDFDRLSKSTLKSSVAQQKILQESLKTDQQRIKLKTQAQNLASAEARVHKATAKSVKSVADLEERRWLAREKINRLSASTAHSLQKQRGANPRLAATDESVEYNRKLTEVSRMASTAKTTSDFRRLNSEISNLNQNKTRLINKNKELQNSFRATGFTARALQDSLRNLARSYVSVFAVIGGSGMAAATGQDLVALRTTLLAATGSAVEAGKAFEFVKSTSLGMGLDLQSATKGFAQMGVAASMAGIDAEQTKEIFTGLAEATSAFGMNTVDAERTLRAITQMMNKGQVYAEELKQQLGESLPAAVPLAAKAMGVTTQELFKMMEQGQLVASDFLPKFTKTLREAVREGNALGEGLNTSRVAMARFGTSFKLNILDSFDAGMEGGMADFFNSLTTFTKEMAPIFRVLGKFVGTVLSYLGDLFMIVGQITRPLRLFLDALVNGGEDGRSAIDGLVKVFRTLYFWILAPFAALQKLNNAIEDADTATKLWAAGGLTATLIVMRKILFTMMSIVTLGGSTAIFKLLKGAGGALGKTSVGSAVKSGASKAGSGLLQSGTKVGGMLGMLAGPLTALGVGYGAYDWWKQDINPISSANPIPTSGDIVKNMFRNGITSNYPVASETKQITNQINIQTHNPEETARQLKPFISGQIDEKFDFFTTTSVAPGG